MKSSKGAVEAPSTDVVDLEVSIPFMASNCSACNIKWVILRIGQVTQDNINDGTFSYMQQISSSMKCPKCGQVLR